MSRLSSIKHQNEGKSPEKGLAEIKTMINEQGRSMSDSSLVKNICSMESLEDNVAAGIEQRVAGISATLRDIFVGHMGIEDFTDAQMEAASITAAAAGDVVAYSAEANKSTADLKVNDAVAVLSGMNGEYDYVDAVVSKEAFSEQELRANLPLSVAYNFLAARQNEFGEAFYPTQALTPDQAALLLKVRKYNVFEQVRHTYDGKVTDFKWRNLVEAARDYKILANETTLIIPAFNGTVADATWANNLVNGSNNYQYFMEDDYISGGFTKTIDGYPVNTRPLRISTDLDLIGISQHPGLIGQADHTDAIDAKVTLQTIYISATSGPTTEVFKFVTSGLPRADFNKTAEGNYREVGLQFVTDALFLDADTKTLSGGANTLLALVTAGDKVQLNLEMGGRVNTETGRTNVFASNVGKRTLDVSGSEIVAPDPIAVAVNAITFTVRGYDLEARRSNANRRSQGLLASPTEEEERYVVPLGSPITSTSPVGTNRDAADLQTLVNITRVRNSNNAVTNMLNYADTLAAHVQNAIKGIYVNIQGLGRHLVTPTYISMTQANTLLASPTVDQMGPLDLPKNINSLTSNERYADVSAALVNAIRDVASRLVRDSGYLQALDITSGGQDMGYEVIIGTDQRISRFIMTSGDTRTLGNGMDCVIVTTPDLRMDDKIVVSLRRKNVQGFDPLSFGSMAYIPELASSIQTARNGATYKEATVQPRTLHIPVLPVFGYIEVVGLSDVLIDNIPLNAFNTVVP